MTQISEKPSPISLRNHPASAGDPPDPLLAHLLDEVHEIVRKLAEWDDLLTEFRPMIEAWRRTNGGTIGLVRARKAMRSGQGT